MNYFKRKSGGFLTCFSGSIRDVLSYIPEGSTNIKVFHCHNGGYHSYTAYYFATFKNSTITAPKSQLFFMGETAKFIPEYQYDQEQKIRERDDRLAVEGWKAVNGEL